MFTFEFFDPPELGDFQAAILALPVVKGRLTDPVGSADIGYLHSGIGFLEDRHDLAFRESALFHWSLGCFLSPILYFQTVPREGKLTPVAHEGTRLERKFGAWKSEACTLVRSSCAVLYS